MFSFHLLYSAKQGYLTIMCYVNIVIYTRIILCKYMVYTSFEICFHADIYRYCFQQLYLMVIQTLVHSLIFGGTKLERNALSFQSAD